MPRGTSADVCALSALCALVVIAADVVAAASGVAPTGAFEGVSVGRAIGPETFVVFPQIMII